MTQARRFAFFVVLAVAITTVGLQAGVKVKIEFDKTYDFTKVRTFAWHPDGAGEVKILALTGDDPEAIRARWEPTITDAVEQELAKRGLVSATTGARDLLKKFPPKPQKK
jgi:hypothetical protein